MRLVEWLVSAVDSYGRPIRPGDVRELADDHAAALIASGAARPTSTPVEQALAVLAEHRAGVLIGADTTLTLQSAAQRAGLPMARRRHQPRAAAES